VRKRAFYRAAVAARFHHQHSMWIQMICRFAQNDSYRIQAIGAARECDARFPPVFKRQFSH